MDGEFGWVGLLKMLELMVFVVRLFLGLKMFFYMLFLCGVVGVVGVVGVLGFIIVGIVNDLCIILLFFFFIYFYIY